jgi:subtilase family serine protease
MTLRKMITSTSWAALALLSLSPLSSQPAFALQEHNVAKAVSLANDLGPVDPNQIQTLTIVLKTHNEAEFDKAIEDLYDPESSSYHQWFSANDFAKYAPTSSELETVKKELVNQGFTVVSTDPQNFSLRVTGTTAKVEAAFQTQLHTFRYNGKTFQAHTQDAELTGAAGQLVDSVVVLDRHQVHTLLSIAQNPRTGKPLFKKTVTTANAGSTLLSGISGTPLSAPALYTFTTPGASLPLGVYYGNVYSTNPALTISYSPAQLQSHYGLTSLIKEGYDGTGQTIALVEAYGYAAAEADANVAAKAFGLPGLTSSNFSVIYPEGKPLNPNAADLTGWTTEIARHPIRSRHRPRSQDPRRSLLWSGQ